MDTGTVSVSRIRTNSPICPQARVLINEPKREKPTQVRTMAQVAATQTTEQPTQAPLPDDIPDWIIDNIVRQYRERYLEKTTIPNLANQQKLALEPLANRRKALAKTRSALNDQLDSNKQKRLNAVKTKAVKKVLVEVLQEEAELEAEKALLEAKKAEIQKQIDDKREELGISEEISVAKLKVKAHKWRRYEQLDKLGLEIGDKPTESEEDDVAAYQLEVENTKRLIRQKLRANL